MKDQLHVWLLAAALLVGIPSTQFADESDVERLQEDISELKAELEALEEKSGDLAKVLENIETAESEIAESIESLPEKESEIEEMGFLYGVYKDSYRIVSPLAPGTALGSFQLRDGRSISSGVFMGTVKGGIKVQTGSGVAEISAGDLPAELATKFNTPQTLSAPPEMGYSELKAAKPLIAKTEAEIEDDKRIAEEAEKRQEMATRKAALEEKAREEQAKEAQMAAEQQSSEKLIAEINALKLQYTDVYNKKKKVRQQKFDQQREFRQAKVKKAQVHVDDVMANFDKEIEKLEDQEDAIKRKISELRTRL